MPLESLQEPRHESVVPCDRCRGATRFTAEVSPLGSEPGVRIYHCPACTCFTVIEWGGRRAETGQQVQTERSRRSEPAMQQAEQHRQKDGGRGE